MRLHTTTILSLTALATLSLASCSHSTPAGTPNSSGSASIPWASSGTPAAEPLSSAALSKRLLDVDDLGESYTRQLPRPEQHDDVTVIGCPALKRLGTTAAGGDLHLPRAAKASFTVHGGSGAEVSEELYSDTPEKLSEGISQIFDAMASCPTYQLASGSNLVNATTQTVTAPRLGDERWSQLLTFTATEGDTVVQQTAVRDGSMLLIMSGSPALVDRYIGKALAKGTTPN